MLRRSPGVAVVFFFVLEIFKTGVAGKENLGAMSLMHGPAVVWPFNDRYGNTQIRCFMPGAGT
jgi:hypothetical protein